MNKPIKMLVMAAALVVGMLSAKATSYTWVNSTGDNKNKWQAAENWTVEGAPASDYPKGGDTAVINSGSPWVFTYSPQTDFPSIATNETLTIQHEVDISANYAYFANIRGTLRFTGAHLFTLGYGGTPTARMEVYNGRLRLVHLGGAGTGELYIDASTGAKLEVVANAGQSVNCPIVVNSTDANDNGQIEQTAEGVTRFKKPISATKKLYLKAFNANSAMIYEGKVSNGEYFFPTKGTHYFCGGVEVATMYGGSEGTCVFSNYCQTARFIPIGNITAATNDFIVSPIGRLTDFSFSAGKTFDLGGFDQHLPQIPATCIAHSGVGFTLTSPTKANLYFNQIAGDAGDAWIWNSRMSGQAGIVWNPSNGKEITINSSNDSSGDFIVQAGSARIRRNAAFLGLGKLEVKKDTKFTVEFGSIIRIGELAAETGAEIAIEEGQVIYATSIRVDGGEAITTPGTYTASSGALAGIISGLGVVKIVSPAVAYVWTGAANDGEWTTPGNWTVGGNAAEAYPNGLNDTVDFGSPAADLTVNVASDIDLGKLTFSGTQNLLLKGSQIMLNNGGIEFTSSGNLTISNDLVVATEGIPFVLEGAGDNAIGKCYLHGNITGTGGIYKTGRMSVYLYGDNSFIGRCVMLGNGKTAEGITLNDNNRGYSCNTYVYTASALGYGEAYFADPQTKDGFGSLLYIYNNTGAEMEIQNTKIYLSHGNNSDPQFYLYNGDVRIAGALHAAGRFRPYLGNGVNKLTIGGDFTSSGWFIPSSASDQSEIIFEGRIASNPTIYLGGIRAIRLQAANNGGLINLNGSGIELDVEDAMPHYADGYTVWSGGSNRFIGLNGCNQHCWFSNNNGHNAVYLLTGTSSFEFRSPVDSPAQLILRPDAYTPRNHSIRYQGRFTGSAGLVWDVREDTNCFIMDGGKSPTIGSLIVNKGGIVFTNEAEMVHLSSVCVNGSGYVEVQEGSKLHAKQLVMEAGCKLSLANDVEAVFGSAMIGDVMLEDGEYTEGEYVIGEGKLIVNSALTASYEWKGESGSFYDPTKWKNGFLPDSAFDTIVLANGGTVENFPADWEFNDLTIGGGEGERVPTTTVVLPADWNTPLKVTSLVIDNGGVLTTAAAFTTPTNEPAARIYLEVGSLEIKEGGAIDMTGKGWSGGGMVDNANHNEGFGPGRAIDSGYGARHLGMGGKSPTAHTESDIWFPYDNPLAPVLPGSGGYANAKSIVGIPVIPSGGGAVRIIAMDNVIVNGSILADGIGSAFRRPGKNYQVSGGSGGSIWITAARVTGSGVISANGGDGDEPRWPSFLYPAANDQLACNTSDGAAGGGGAIAIETSNQTPGDCEGMRISAGCGKFSSPYKPNLNYGEIDKWNSQADLGTLHFTNEGEVSDMIIRDTLGKGLTGRIVDDIYPFEIDDYAFQWGSGYVRFAGEGADVRFSGDLNIYNADSRLEVGGISNRLYGTRVYDMHAGRTPVSLSVGGKLDIGDGASVAIRPASVGAEDGFGAHFSIAGDLNVNDDGHIFPYCDYLNGKPCRIDVAGNAFISSQGEINAYLRGISGDPDDGAYSAMKNFIGHSINNGNGYTPYSKIGGSHISASHGGYGARCLKNGVYQGSATDFRAPYDDEFRPCMSGAGGTSAGYAPGSDGGGVVYLVAKGNLVVNGLVNADAQDMIHYFGNVYSYYPACGSGGTIFLSGATFSGSGTLTAKGGNFHYNEKSYYWAATGGGGRIAVWSGAEYTPGAERNEKRFTSATEPFENQPANVFTGTVSAEGGKLLKRDGASWEEYTEEDFATYVDALGTDGTIRFCHLSEVPGLMFIVK